MKLRVSVFNILAGSSFLALSSGADAQAPSGASATAPSSILEEIIVTARRKEESLSDVPQTVNVVGAPEIQKLSLQKFEDVQALVPGLTMSSGATGYTTAATVRGASFQVESGASPTVEFYLNDAPIQSSLLFQSMYDVGQVEVLRGPQGTLRGRASPSGSITVTTRQPDVAEIGGYVNVLGTSEEAIQVNGAVNFPIIKDRLAVRVAANYDDNQYNHVSSLFVGKDPAEKTKSGRVSLSWLATDTVTANFMYQHLERDQYSYDQHQSYYLASPPIPTPVVLPTINADDRRSAFDGYRDNTQEVDIANARLDWRIGGQKLSYVGAYSKNDLVGLTPQDLGIVVSNFEYYQDLHTQSIAKAHELRISSEERLFEMLDYTAGVFYQDFTSPADIINRTLIALPSALTGGAVVSALVAPQPIERRSNTKEKSIFANVTVHLGENTELAAGARYIDYKATASLNVVGLLTADESSSEKPVIWNVTGSHRFTEDYMLYANVGTSWRDGPSAVGIFRPTTPNLTKFTNLESEDSTSYELGFKADYLDKRMRLSLSVFHQDFDNFIYRGPPVWFVDLGRSGPAPAQFPLLASVDAKVDGVELGLALQATENFNIDVTAAYAKGEMKNGVIPCNDFDRNGAPDLYPPIAPSFAQIMASIPTANPLTEAVASCAVNDRLSFAPNWSSTLRADYTWPVTASMGIFGRGLYSYYASNVNDPNNPYDNVGAYGLLNLYAGLRSRDGAWEISLFARNALDTQKILNRSSGPTATSYQELVTATGATTFGTSKTGGYMTVSQTPLQEFGLSLRYSFGSR